MKPPPRTRNPETLAILGQQLRRTREAAGLSQGKVQHMRQGTISKIENGLDVTLDTLLTYAASLGLEVALVPIGQATALQLQRSSNARHSAAATDLLEEFEHLKDSP